MSTNDRLTVSECGSMMLEFVLASMLGMMLVGITYELYLAGWKSFQLQHEIMQLEESARYVSAILTHEIHLAGYAKSNGSIKVKKNELIVNYPNRQARFYVSNNCLYKEDSSHRSRILVEGIKSIHFKFGQRALSIKIILKSKTLQRKWFVYVAL